MSGRRPAGKDGRDPADVRAVPADVTVVPVWRSVRGRGTPWAGRGERESPRPSAVRCRCPPIRRPRPLRPDPRRCAFLDHGDRYGSLEPRRLTQHILGIRPAMVCVLTLTSSPTGRVSRSFAGSAERPFTLCVRAARGVQGRISAPLVDREQIEGSLVPLPPGRHRHRRDGARGVATLDAAESRTRGSGVPSRAMRERRIVVPPEHLFPADEWRIVETRWTPGFAARAETALALSNGYLGVRGTPRRRTPGRGAGRVHQRLPRDVADHPRRGRLRVGAGRSDDRQRA